MAHLHENTVIAGLIGIAVGLIKLIEVIVSSVWKKLFDKKDEEHGNGHASYAELDPDTARALREAHEDHLKLARESRNSIADLVNCLKDISHSQERIASCLERLEEDSQKSFKRVRDDVSELFQAVKRDF
jgi:hypothetical protein